MAVVAIISAQLHFLRVKQQREAVSLNIKSISRDNEADLLSFVGLGFGVWCL